MPASLVSLMWQLGLEFVLILEPAGSFLDRPNADLGFDSTDLRWPQRHWYRIHEVWTFDVARRLWLDRTFDVRRAFRRKLTC